MSSKVKYTPVESGSLSLGSAGAQVSTGAALSGQFCAIQAVTNTTFTSLTAEDDSHITAIPGGTLPAGMIIYGRWTAIDVNTGNIIAYNG